MKLFLQSECDSTLHKLQELTQINPTNTKVAFIPNAGTPYKESSLYPAWLTNDFKKWQELGYDTTWLDLETDLEILKKQRFDIIHFAGGSPIYLLVLFRKLDLIPYLKDLIADQKVTFSGASAGAMVAGVDLSVERYADLEIYPENKDLIPILNSDFTALSLVNFNILPHFNSLDAIPQNLKVIANPTPNQAPLVFLSDNQAIWVENDKIQFISA